MFEFSRRRVPGHARRVALGAAFALLALVVAILVTGCKPWVLVVLDPDNGVATPVAHLSKAEGTRLYWHNKDNQAHTIKFVPGEWPFTGSQHDIVVPPHGFSEGLRLSPNVPKDTRCNYGIVPPLDAIPPPDGPAVVVDG